MTTPNDVPSEKVLKPQSPSKAWESLKNSDANDDNHDNDGDDDPSTKASGNLL